MKEMIETIIHELDALLSTYSFGRIIRDGVNVALMGQPNVGKSSLLNYMLKESRAIVSEIPGTTRDIIREEVSIDGILFRLFDTAGIRATNDSVEKEGVTRSRDAIKNADVVLFINDVEQDFSTNIYSELISLTSKEKILCVMNKIDLNEDWSKVESQRLKIEGLNSNLEDRSLKIGDEIVDVRVSAKTGEGMDILFRKLKEAVFGSSYYTEQTAIVSNARHYESLKKAKRNLVSSLDAIEKKMSGEFISIDLRNAENSLSEIIGLVTSEDILNNIFAKFCIGK